jgi:NADH:ubiquinone oxidoreductase subunit 3 (subunit A)
MLHQLVLFLIFSIPYETGEQSEKTPTMTFDAQYWEITNMHIVFKNERLLLGCKTSELHCILPITQARPILNLE